MKSRKASDLRELTSEELLATLTEAQETFAKQRFQNALKTLQDTSYLKILRKDIARIKTILNERKTSA